MTAQEIIAALRKVAPPDEVFTEGPWPILSWKTGKDCVEVLVGNNFVDADWSVNGDAGNVDQHGNTFIGHTVTFLSHLIHACKPNTGVYHTEADQ